MRRMHGARVALALACLASMMAAGPAARAGTAPIRPGAFMNSPAGCTLNFVFTDGQDLYIGTAGHCTSAVGNRVHTPSTGAFGTVAFRRFSGRDDVAFVRVDADKAALVSPTMDLFGTPTGVTTAEETLPGDPLGLEGNGIVLGQNPGTRNRVGLLAWDDPYRYVAELPAIFGDSGGPVVHLLTGKALGIVSGITVTIPPSTLVGTTVDRALRIAAEEGLILQLVTA